MTQRECLAVFCELLLIDPSLEGSPFTVHTDNYARKRIIDLKEATGKLARW